MDYLVGPLRFCKMFFDNIAPTATDPNATDMPKEDRKDQFLNLEIGLLNE